MSVPEIKYNLTALAHELQQAGNNFKKHSKEITKLVQTVSDETPPATLLSRCRKRVFAKISALDLFQNNTAEKACKAFYNKYLHDGFAAVDIITDLQRLSQECYPRQDSLFSVVRDMSKDTEPADIFTICREQIFSKISPTTSHNSFLGQNAVHRFLVKYPEADTQVQLGQHSISKLLLSAQSQTIEEMLKENVDASTPVFEQNDVTEAFYRFILTGDLIPMTSERFLDLVEFAHQYNCTALEKACANKFPHIELPKDKGKILSMWKRAKTRHMNWLQVQLLQKFKYFKALIPDELQAQAEHFSKNQKFLSTYDATVKANISNPQEKLAFLALEISCSELCVLTPITAAEFATLSQFSTLSNVILYASTSTELLAQLSNVQSLCSLSVRSCVNFNAISTSLKDILTNNRSIKTLEIDIRSSEHADFRELIEALQTNSTLCILRIDAKIENDTATAFCSALQNNTTLKHLDLRGSTMTISTARKLYSLYPDRVFFNLDNLQADYI